MDIVSPLHLVISGVVNTVLSVGSFLVSLYVAYKLVGMILAVIRYLAFGYASEGRRRIVSGTFSAFSKDRSYGGRGRPGGRGRRRP